jgi:guanine deaminase
MKAPLALRGRLFWFEDDPETAGEAAHRYVEDGLLVMRDGVIAASGEARLLLPTLPAGTRLIDHRPHLICPGFIDAHLHLPQTQVIASHGAQLMDWLTRYTFVEEQRFSDVAHAAHVARFFCDELIRNGTTTCVAFGSVHPQSVEALFREAGARNMRLIAGKVMMDRNAPEALRDTAQKGFDESEALIARWHGRTPEGGTSRLGYAISPRFAITSSEAQLEAAGALMRSHPGCHMQTHLSENIAEIESVQALFPAARDYTDVYGRFDLLGPRSLFGHCIHLSDREWRALAESGSVAVSCPTSNFFLGSGCFDRARARKEGVRTGIATDIGAGTSYSMLATMGAAYQAAQLRGASLSPLAAFHWATRGNALALGLEGKIGSLGAGHEADVIVLDARATPAMAHRMDRIESLVEELFVLMVMGDDRAVRASYVAGAEAVTHPEEPRSGVSKDEGSSLAS